MSKYAEYYPISRHLLIPYSQSCLLNPALRRDAPLINTPIIHQVWFSKTPPSPIRMRLHQTLIDSNPGFQVRLWKLEDISKEQVPITYRLITNVMESTKYASINMAAMAVDLFRYEILYNYGGIYIDFKFEGLKPMDEFLKYELFFIDCDLSTWRLGSPKPVGNGVMGALPNSYHLGIMLH